MDMNTTLEKALNGGFFFFNTKIIDVEKLKYSVRCTENLHLRNVRLGFLPYVFFVAVFAVTAADPFESSYACYYDSTRQTYLGDVFSVMWMQDSEKVWLVF